METTANKKGLFLAAVTVAAAVAVGAFYFATKGDGEKAAEATVVKVAKPSKKAKRALQRPSARREARDRKAFEGSAEKSDLDISPEELATLTPELRKILEDLEAAVDAEDAKKVSKLAEQILVTQRRLGEDSVPPFVRAAAVEAIGNFLPGSLADLVGFMADSDPDVLQDVMDKFSEAIDDPDLGDRELSAILTSVAGVMTDDDAVDALLFAIETDMRNSVAVETYLKVWEIGSEQVKEKIVESIADFTGEDEVTTPEELKKWLNENPDDEDDDEMFSGNKDDGDDD